MQLRIFRLCSPPMAILARIVSDDSTHLAFKSRFLHNQIHELRHLRKYWPLHHHVGWYYLRVVIHRQIFIPGSEEYVWSKTKTKDDRKLLKLGRNKAMIYSILLKTCRKDVCRELHNAKQAAGRQPTYTQHCMQNLLFLGNDALIHAVCSGPFAICCVICLLKEQQGYILRYSFRKVT